MPTNIPKEKLLSVALASEPESVGATGPLVVDIPG